MLSWTFAAATAALALLAGVVPARWRAPLVALASVGTVRLVWHVPLAPLAGVVLGVWGVGRLLPRLAPGPRAAALAVAIGAILFGLLATREASLGVDVRVVGASYLALKLLQHLVDAAAGRAKHVDAWSFVGVTFLLPTWAAGPIERSGDFARELARPAMPFGDRARGLERVVTGLATKALVADPLLAWAQPALRDAGALAPGHVLLAIDAFAIGLYLDFAAYSALAIGTARCLGLRVRENFDRPYLQPNLALLWQRWHMSLTGWLRDYVFLPVTRRTLRRTRRPLASQICGQVATMVACGLWHGAEAKYVLWGLYHAGGLSALAAWRAFRGPTPPPGGVARVAAIVATFHFFALGLVVFACDLRGTARVLARLVGATI